ncbi:hypothetical protein XIS1_1040022 [Xenorhabdus innexi]|uniref:Uncharacterized protein n=1 Tax=Xenorhabdus innexi TaxID=290109 RepID=A0A1N6MQJ6_9GAMM|nr:hypothetical protein XIS1_1040022 [Xenorhabdus innexi]
MTGVSERSQQRGSLKDEVYNYRPYESLSYKGVFLGLRVVWIPLG